MPAAVGVGCLIASYLPSLIYIFVPMGPGQTMHLDLLMSGWFVGILAVGFITGIISAIALNGAAVSMAWILGMTSALYAALNVVTWNGFGLPIAYGVDWQAALFAFTTFLYVIGVILVAATGGKEA